MKKSIDQKFSENFKNIPPSFVREILQVADQQNLISFAGGLPKPELFPVSEIAASAQAVLNEAGRSILQYAGSQGHYELRQWIANRYNKKYNLRISPNDVVITNGSQQAIDVVSKMFINPGDALLVEKPTYLGAIQATSAYRPCYFGIDLLPDGPDMEQFETYCKTMKPSFFYGIPTFQNPSGLRYSLEKRIATANLLQSHNVLMLEDDPYHEIYFDQNNMPPIYSFAPDHVIWTGSFSKIVAPGLRMGWAVLPKGLASHFVKAKQSTDLHSNNLTQFILHHFLTHNNIDRHLEKVRNAYREQCSTMQQLMCKHLPDEVKQTNPQGGMFIWLTLPSALDSEQLVKHCMAEGVVFVPGKSFYTNGKGQQNIRMNFSNASLSEMERGIQIMGAIMEKALMKHTVAMV